MNISIKSISILFFSCLIAANILAQSSITGTGISTNCNGGPLIYCAPTDRNTRSIPVISPPAVNVPFINDFGELSVRITGPDTMTGFSGINNPSFTGASADTVNQISNYDSLACGGAGGYRLIVVGYQGGVSGAWVPFEICPATNTTVKVVGIGSSTLATTGQLGVANPSFNFVDPAVLYYTSGTTLYSYCFPDASLTDPLCPAGRDASNTIYNFNSCPNLPTAIPTGDQIGPYNSKDGRYIGASFAISQNEYGLIFRYDTQTGNCMWFSPATYEYGGTGITTTKASGGPLGDPSDPMGLLGAPIVTPVTGTGSIPAGTYYIKWTGNGQVQGFFPSVLTPTIQNNLNGQSAGSTETTVTLSATGELKITPAICFSASVNSRWCNTNEEDPLWMPYIGTSSGRETLQNEILLGTGNGTTTTFSGVTPYDLTPYEGGIVIVAGNVTFYENTGGSIQQLNISNGTHTTVGTIVYTSGGAVNVTFPIAPAAGVPVYLEWWFPADQQEIITSLQTNGPSPPTISTAGSGLHYAALSLGGDYYWYGEEGTSQNTNAAYWHIGFNDTPFGTVYNGTTGHVALGYGMQTAVACVVTPNVPCNVDIDTAPFSNPGSYSSILASPPPYSDNSKWIGDSQHTAYNNDNPADTLPFLEGYSPSNGFLQPSSALQYEIFGVTPGFNKPVYRFAFSRSTGIVYEGGAYDFWHLTYGGISDDARWIDYSTTWDNALGFIVSVYKTSTAYTSGAEVTDSNHNLEIETAASCTSGSSAPTWPAAIVSSIGTLTSDNGCSWDALGIYGQPFAGLRWTSLQNYQSGIYIIDSSGRLQEQTVSHCFSGSTTPAFSTGIVSDGTCSWTFILQTPLSGTPTAVWTRLDVFAVKIR